MSADAGFTRHGLQQANRVVIQIVNPKGEMKGSAITGPVGKEAAELWPVCQKLDLTR